MKTVLILGAGAMGSGIAQVAAQSGCKVFLRDIKDEFVAKGLAGIGKNLGKLVEKGKMQAADKDALLGRITGTVDVGVAKDADFVIEAAIENMALKKTIYAELDSTLKPEAILATNTSSLSITEIGAATKRPDKVIGMHFFNPAPVMALVEVIRGIATSDATYNATMELARSFGKTPVTVHEAPGFVVNRILIPLINEGAFVLSEGTATAEDIDTAMKLGANHPMGPLALGDLIGLDVCQAIMDVLYNETGDSKYRTAPIIRKMVRAGKLGRKTGEGFFKY
jgi:3-hydroxybutyryl-CoA dehydrogenase